MTERGRPTSEQQQALEQDIDDPDRFLAEPEGAAEPAPAEPAGQPEEQAMRVDEETP